MTLGLNKHFDRQGRPITEDEFHRLHADADYRVVRRTELVGANGRKLHVITSWFGTDQGSASDGSGTPLIFGTVGRDADTGDWLDHLEQFHATEAEALAYHEQTVQELATQ